MLPVYGEKTCLIWEFDLEGGEGRTSVELVESARAETNTGRCGERELSRVEETDEGILKDLSPHLHLQLRAYVSQPLPKKITNYEPARRVHPQGHQ